PANTKKSKDKGKEKAVELPQPDSAQRKEPASTSKSGTSSSRHKAKSPASPPDGRAPDQNNRIWVATSSQPSKASPLSSSQKVASASKTVPSESSTNLDIDQMYQNRKESSKTKSKMYCAKVGKKLPSDWEAEYDRTHREHLDLLAYALETEIKHAKARKQYDLVTSAKRKVPLKVEDEEYKRIIKDHHLSRWRRTCGAEKG
ncbi:hypothetical protein C8J56DRAFT_936105, partial [Mycena floridula]